MPRGGKRVGAGRKRTRPEKPAAKQAAVVPPVVETPVEKPSEINQLLAKCTKREQAFVLNLLADPEGNQTRAYERAGFNARGASAMANASKCLRKDQVRAAFESMRGQVLAADQSKAIADATERREWLTRMMRDAEAHPIARLKAVDIQNRMDGLYAVKLGLTGAKGEALAPRRVIIELDDASAGSA